MSYASVSEGGMTISSNVVAEDQIRREMTPDAPDPSPTVDTPDPSEPAKTETQAETSARERDEASGQFKPKSDKPRHNPQARVEQATREAATARREAEDARREAAEAREALAKVQKPVEPVKPGPAPEFTPTRAEPKLDDFADQGDPYSAWMDARVDWKLEQRDAKAAADATKRDADARYRAAAERITKAKATMPDLDAQITAADATLVSAGFVGANGQAAWPVALVEAIIQSEQSAELVHYLGSHPEECRQWAEDARSLPASAATAVRRLLERSLIPSPSPSAERTTGPAAAVLPRVAAQPISPVRSGSPATMGGPPGDNATAAEHAAYYDRLEREARRRPA